MSHWIAAYFVVGFFVAFALFLKAQDRASKDMPLVAGLAFAIMWLFWPAMVIYYHLD